MIVATMLLACSSTGAEVTLTDLVDPSGHLEESWTADTAYWNWSEGESELWALSESTGTLTSQGAQRYDPMHFSTVSSECGDLQDWLDVGAALVAEVEDGDAVADHCDAMNTYFEDLAALDSGEESITLTGYIDDLVGGTPGTGSWSEPDVNGYLLWTDGQASAADGWDAEACTYTFVDPGNGAQVWVMPELTLTIDDADGPVVGSLDAELLGDDGGTATLSATFEAEFCQFSGGAVVLTLP